MPAVHQRERDGDEGLDVAAGALVGECDLHGSSSVVRVGWNATEAAFGGKTEVLGV